MHSQTLKTQYSLSRVHTWKIHKCHDNLLCWLCINSACEYAVYMCSMYFVHTTAIVHNAHSYKFAMVNFCINNQRKISYLEAYIAKSPTAQDTFWPIAGLSMYKHVNSSLMCRLNASLDGHLSFCLIPRPHKNEATHFHDPTCS